MRFFLFGFQQLLQDFELISFQQVIIKFMSLENNKIIMIRLCL